MPRPNRAILALTIATMLSPLTLGAAGELGGVLPSPSVDASLAVPAAPTLPDPRTCTPAGCANLPFVVDEVGDVMRGDLVFGAYQDGAPDPADLRMVAGNIVLEPGTQVRFPAGDLAAPAGEALQFNGLSVCTASGPTSCGTVTRVEAGAGLAGGPITAAGALRVADSGIVQAMIAAGAVGAAQVDAASVQLRIVGECAEGMFISSIAQDGTVTCGEDRTGSGAGNNASEPSATAAGGENNTATAPYATVSGGLNNTASGLLATVAGGFANVASGFGSTVGGGDPNVCSGDFCTIAGGQDNTAGGPWSAIGGGLGNLASGDASRVGGGRNNSAEAGNATVGGGSSNLALGFGSTIAGGMHNNAQGIQGTVGGGYDNFVLASHYGTIAGGSSNTVRGFGGVIGGGAGNQVNGTDATVAGGSDNRASQWMATVPGGQGNAADGAFSLAAGRRAVADHHGAFVWSDANNWAADPFPEFASTGPDQFLVRARGGVGIGTNAPQAQLHVAGDVRWTGALQQGSVPWARVTSMPPACAAGQFVTALGLSLACAAPPQSGWVDSAPGNAVTTATASRSVGIGTSTPHSFGGTTQPGSSGPNLNVRSSSGPARIIADAAGGAAELHLIDRAAPVHDRNYRLSASQASNALVLDQPSDGYGAAQQLMAWTPAGNVGIGTSDPKSKLDIRGAVGGFQFDPDLVLVRSNFDGYELSLQGGNTIHNGGRLRLGGGARGDADVNVVQFFQGTAERMRIHDGGNVGIGTASPLAKLEVNGALKLGHLPLAACDDAHRGTMQFVAGPPDILYACLQNGDGTNAWKVVATGTPLPN